MARRIGDVVEDERGERLGLRARRVLMGLLTLVPLVALTGLLGQRATVTSAAGATTTVIATVAVLVVFTAWLGFRFARLRPILEGHPTLLVADGEVLSEDGKVSFISR